MGDGRAAEGGTAAAAWRVLACTFVALLALIAAAPAGAAGREPLVFGGNDAPLGDWSWTVALIDPDHPVAADGQFCGGTLVAPTVVVTAAHCIISGRSERVLPLQSIAVVTGAVDLAGELPPGAQRIAVAEIHQHPQYNPRQFGHDLAVLILAEPSTARPARIISDRERGRVRPGVQTYIGGWGLMQEGRRLPSRLQVAQVPVQPDWMCAIFSSDVWDGGTMSCAGAMRRFSCSGDSGGPLMVRDRAGVPVVTGVVSFGGILCDTFLPLPTAFTDLAAYDDWIAAWLPPELRDTTDPEPANDVLAPRLKALPTTGELGRPTPLPFVASDDSGTVRPTITVYSGRRVLFRFPDVGYILAPGFSLAGRWKAPLQRPADLHFCVRVRDRAGHQAARSCAPIRLVRPRQRPDAPDGPGPG